MNNVNLKTILNEYERKRNYEINALETRRNELYQQIPRLQQIDSELSSSSISTAKNLIKFNNPNLIYKLQENIKNLKEEKKTILK